ncbi:hypothetical protein SAMN04488524_0452 [Pedobacter africanus]|uniref:Uncharacterized protein n=1 Tax=Pedobacter africanus TaxID=151894 RepID=A0A1W1Z7S4_9SPHI|nr:hypothetical protein SAMN04488524_0452 [Pedobacter africanus]
MSIKLFVANFPFSMTEIQLLKLIDNPISMRLAESKRLKL